MSSSYGSSEKFSENQATNMKGMPQSVPPTKENYPPSHKRADGNKRAHHNLLERQRRDEINASYAALQGAIPSLRNMNKQASRQDVLNRAVDHIVTMKETNSSKARKLADLRKQNDQIVAKIRAMEQEHGLPPHSFEFDDDSSDDETLFALQEVADQPTSFYKY